MLNQTERTKADIARENGAKSHGPITAEGRARSSRNAATHSLSTAHVVCLTNEDQQRYGTHCQSYANFWKPENIMELDLVEEMAASKWQERRCQAIETAILNLQIEMQKSGDPQINIEELSSAERTALAFMDLADHSKVLQLLLRYGSEHNRRYHRAMRQIIALRKNGVAALAEKRNEPTAATNTNKTSVQQPPKAQPEAPAEARPTTQAPTAPDQEAPTTAEPLVFRRAAA